MIFIPHHRTTILLALILLYSFETTLPQSNGRPLKRNGFDLKNLSINSKFLRSGGPPRDGIPSIDNPRFVSSQLAAAFLADDDKVLALSLNGVAKAYPIKILDRHEIVNDHFGAAQVVVTYCPLCGSGMAFDSTIGGPKTFGVSGLLYNSDVLLYDRETESLWSQIAMTSVSGPMQGRKLTPLPIERTSWKSWRNRHPKSLVLSNQQGIYPPKAYETNAYEGYENSKRIWFPVENKNNTLHPKAWVLGISSGNEAKAYPLDNLPQDGTPITDKLGELELTIRYDPGTDSAQAFDSEGHRLPNVLLYWFAWYAFNPNTQIYSENISLRE